MSPAAFVTIGLTSHVQNIAQNGGKVFRTFKAGEYLVKELLDEGELDAYAAAWPRGLAAFAHIDPGLKTFATVYVCTVRPSPSRLSTLHKLWWTTRVMGLINVKRSSTGIVL